MKVTQNSKSNKERCKNFQIFSQIRKGRNQKVKEPRQSRTTKNLFQSRIKFLNSSPSLVSPHLQKLQQFVRALTLSAKLQNLETRISQNLKRPSAQHSKTQMSALRIPFQIQISREIIPGRSLVFQALDRDHLLHLHLSVYNGKAPLQMAASQTFMVIQLSV